MSYVVVDATELDPHELKCALVIDKGTADAIACNGDEAVMSLAKAVQSCLTEDGMWISLSYSSLRFDLEQMPLDVEVASKIPTFDLATKLKDHGQKKSSVLGNCLRLQQRTSLAPGWRLQQVAVMVNIGIRLLPLGGRDLAGHLDIKGHLLQVEAK